MTINNCKLQIAFFHIQGTPVATWAWNEISEFSNYVFFSFRCQCVHFPRPKCVEMHEPGGLSIIVWWTKCSVWKWIFPRWANFDYSVSQFRLKRTNSICVVLCCHFISADASTVGLLFQNRALLALWFVCRYGISSKNVRLNRASINCLVVYPSEWRSPVWRTIEVIHKYTFKFM